jgi:hypothetical protein
VQPSGGVGSGIGMGAEAVRARAALLAASSMFSESGEESVMTSARRRASR